MAQRANRSYYLGAGKRTKRWMEIAHILGLDRRFFALFVNEVSEEKVKKMRSMFDRGGLNKVKHIIVPDEVGLLG